MTWGPRKWRLAFGRPPLERSPDRVWMAIEPESKLLLVMDVGTRTAKFQELVQNVEHHVEEEEAAMFPLVEEALAEDLTEMQEEMQELKADIQGS